jgi:hypothetical protein
MDILPALLYGGLAAFVLGIMGAIAGWPLSLSGPVKYSKRTERIIHLAIGIAGGVAVPVAHGSSPGSCIIDRSTHS